ncbi:MAG: hypothetical protein AAF809_03895 [Bacteroidota bacterium]
MTVERAHRILEAAEPGVWTRADVEPLLPALRQWVSVAVDASRCQPLPTNTLD